jgi:mannose-6-phosphate isomerase-like protein (cupin superfamily)
MRSSGDAEEVLFIVGGHARLTAAGSSHGLEPESGAYIPPGCSYELENTGERRLRIVAVRIPDPEPGAGMRTPVIRRLADQEAHEATTDREFRIVADPATGLRSATHFVGYIPTKRAPDHFHTYDEVIYVLDGEGVFHADGQQRPLGPGSCIELAARTVHCLENTGDRVMRVVAVFRPAGSPAAAYYPDGTPAYAGMPPVQAP